MVNGPINNVVDSLLNEIIIHSCGGVDGIVVLVIYIIGRISSPPVSRNSRIRVSIFKVDSYLITIGYLYVVKITSAAAMEIKFEWIVSGCVVPVHYKITGKKTCIQQE